MSFNYSSNIKLSEHVIISCLGIVIISFLHSVVAAQQKVGKHICFIHTKSKSVGCT